MMGERETLFRVSPISSVIVWNAEVTTSKVIGSIFISLYTPKLTNLNLL
jgi:hypothetical protein